MVCVVEDASECCGPWPSGREVECVSAGGVGHATGRGNKFAADRGTGDEFGSAGADEYRPAGQVVREGGEAQPCGVRVEPAGWAVREAVVFQVTDREFNNGVGAVVEIFIS
jgi:hypothetical protein